VKEGLHVSVFAGILAVNKLRPRYWIFESG
jgi:hypothetical protein